MYPDLLRKTALVAAIVLPLACASCKRQSGESTQPVVEQGKADASNTAVGTAGSAARASAAPAAAAATATSPDEEIERDPDAITALENMSTYLRALKAIQVHAVTSRDEVLEDGQNVTFSGTVDMIAERPNRLRAEVVTDKQDRMYFADGKTFSVWARRVNYYATIPAPPTLRQLAETLTDRYNLELPVADLFYWGDGKSTADIVGAVDLGPSQVDGTTCEHYAFRQEGADWQIWIQQGGHPLPRKLVITTTTDPARPRYTSVITWNLAPSYNDAAFTFDPPKDARKILLAEARSGHPK
ncbi:MAG TPA: DUF2092 domain-containing protein [Vicinamibacterales bacterium]|jgi:hypothetical protein|nr:DUF2092 domain-containing protein [Vicinamibacterales bacterium]